MVPAHWPWPPKKDQGKDVTNDCSPARCFLKTKQRDERGKKYNPMEFGENSAIPT